MPAPRVMTREELERHQVIRTPYAQGCRHRAAAGVARQKHPKKGKHMHFVPDVGGSHEDPTGGSKENKSHPITRRI